MDKEVKMKAMMMFLLVLLVLPLMAVELYWDDSMGAHNISSGELYAVQFDEEKTNGYSGWVTQVGTFIWWETYNYEFSIYADDGEGYPGELLHTFDTTDGWPWEDSWGYYWFDVEPSVYVSTSIFYVAAKGLYIPEAGYYSLLTHDDESEGEHDWVYDPYTEEWYLIEDSQFGDLTIRCYWEPDCPFDHDDYSVVTETTWGAIKAEF